MDMKKEEDTKISSTLLDAVQTDLFQFLSDEKSDVFEQGRKAGEKAGYEKAQSELGALFSLLQTISHKILEHKARLLDQLKPDLFDFSITLCERVIRQELSQPEKFAKLIDSLLTATIPSLQGELIKVYLAPDDLVNLEDHLGKIQYDKKEIKGIRFLSDPLMRRGDCRLETKTALLNYSISRELEGLRSKILQQGS